MAVQTGTNAAAEMAVQTSGGLNTRSATSGSSLAAPLSDAGAQGVEPPSSVGLHSTFGSEVGLNSSLLPLDHACLVLL